VQKQVVVKQTVVSVDLNSLLQQIRDGGIVALYRCPRCGGNLKIDKETTIESLKVCPYCGSNIKAMDLAEFLRTALS
jgi:DNA-directed RNA polymerase subunit RPC12/RpoP